MSTPIDRTQIFKDAKRIVVKVGSNILTLDHGLNLALIDAITGQIHQLIQGGMEIILVTSGAMACGVKKIGLPKRPKEIPERQAVAAVGQAGLMRVYEKAFDRYQKKVAQILLTQDDLVHRRRYLNARNTLNTLIAWNIVPIINENDTVVIEEIKFGDNDNLAAMITLLLDADVLINLTDIDGLYTKDPRVHKDAELIPQVTSIQKNILDMASNIPGALGTGGMLTKIKAARKLSMAGIPMLIAKGTEKDILLTLVAGGETGTLFIPKKEKLASRKCWIGFSLTPEGTIMIDEGAAEAILKKGKSLLPSGIFEVIGDFGMGAPVEFTCKDRVRLGVGLVNYSASEIRKIMGQQSDCIETLLGYKHCDEVVHRDNLAIMEECAI